MDIYHLFSDASVDPKSKIGYGAYILLKRDIPESLNEDIIKKKIKLKKFVLTSSTRLEIETLLWALKDTEEIFSEVKDAKVIIYTDSQNISGLLKRRSKLEENNFQSGNTGEKLKNAYLYKDFFEVTGRMNCSINKIKGHMKSSEKDIVNIIFSFVDRATRKALRVNV